MTDRFIPTEDGDEGPEDETAAGSGKTWVVGDDDWVDPFDIPSGDATEPTAEEEPVTPEPVTEAVPTIEEGDDWGLVDAAVEDTVPEDPWADETRDPVTPLEAAAQIGDPAWEAVVDPLIDWPEDVAEVDAPAEEILAPAVESSEESPVVEQPAEEAPSEAPTLGADPFVDVVAEAESDLDEAAESHDPAAEPDAAGGDPFADPSPAMESDEAVEAQVTEEPEPPETAVEPIVPDRVDELLFVAESAVPADPFEDVSSEVEPVEVADDPADEESESPEGIEWVFLGEEEDGGHWGFVADVVPEGDDTVEPVADTGSDSEDELAEADVEDEGGSPGVVSDIEEAFRLEELRDWEEAKATDPAWRVGVGTGRPDEDDEPADDDESEDREDAPGGEAPEEIVVVERGDRKSGKLYLADAAWLGGEALARKVLFEVVDGRFVLVKPSSKNKEAKRLRGIVLPGLVNTHSHAFHRLLRGRTHRQGGDFWSWRDRMFDVAIALDPVGYEDVATAVFVEMAMAGITMVGEFHYLHHRIGGVPYRDPNEMGHAMIRAARRAGIRIGLLDAGYLAAGFGRPALHPVQERFSDGTGEAWLERAGLLCEEYADEDDVRIGLAPHSVRAVPDDALRRLAEWRNPETRLHVHVSEQPAENLSCMAAHGLTPVGLLESSGLLGPTTTAIHATHLTDGDIDILGSTRTGVCLCPTTERDLADGIGPSRALRMAGSTLTVGSDSHSEIDLFEEARGIEHHHRLAAGRRGGFAPAALLEAATVNGSDALGFGPHGIQVGAPADFLVLNADSPRLAGLPRRAESVVFAAAASDVTDVYVGGKKIVSKGVHPQWKKARKTFRARR